MQAKKRLVALQALLTNRNRSGQCITPWAVLGPNARRPLEGFLETEVLELKQLVGILQRDLDCLLQQLKGQRPRAPPVAVLQWPMLFGQDAYLGLGDPMRLLGHSYPGNGCDNCPAVGTY